MSRVDVNLSHYFVWLYVFTWTELSGHSPIHSFTINRGDDLSRVYVDLVCVLTWTSLVCLHDLGVSGVYLIIDIVRCWLDQ